MPQVEPTEVELTEQEATALMDAINEIYDDGVEEISTLALVTDSTLSVRFRDRERQGVRTLVKEFEAVFSGLPDDLVLSYRLTREKYGI